MIRKNYLTVPKGKIKKKFRKRKTLNFANIKHPPIKKTFSCFQNRKLAISKFPKRKDYPHPVLSILFYGIKYPQDIGRELNTSSKGLMYAPYPGRSKHSFWTLRFHPYQKFHISVIIVVNTFEILAHSCNTIDPHICCTEELDDTNESIPANK